MDDLECYLGLKSETNCKKKGTKLLQNINTRIRLSVEREKKHKLKSNPPKQSKKSTNIAKNNVRKRNKRSKRSKRRSSKRTAQHKRRKSKTRRNTRLNTNKRQKRRSSRQHKK